MENLALPTLDELVEELRDTRYDVRREYIDDDYDNECCVDVRLRVFGDDWYVYTGSSDYDQDHRGYWGASSVHATNDEDELIDIARDLIQQVKDHANQ